ncbi:hypothetical protein [Xanthocytophaga agilis]|uniref:Uncharacterized protein n=1 Tax=Xanthocytophaga agilis TaxID=3048010 RepID=A0AAE3UGV3_9BACT|nr:hypothetical protein [Xanthocytophaga agilis]MDJ1501993.1 hypothetical protein [Xanthocytophaga agilis]
MYSAKELIDQIRINPNLVGTKSVFCLKAFFDGWYFRKVPPVSEAYLEYKFQSWIEEKLEAGPHCTCSWARIICLVNQDEYDAFFHFFELFDRFYQEVDLQAYEEVPYSRVAPYDHYSIEALLEKLQTRTPMYIGHNTLTCLDSFLRGWYLRDPDGITDWHIMEGFESWLIAKNKFYPGPPSWQKIISYYSSNYSPGLFHFFEEYNEYIQTIKKQ